MIAVSGAVIVDRVEEQLPGAIRLVIPGLLPRLSPA